MDGRVILAAELLIGLSDDQIQCHGFQMQRVVDRITRVIRPQSGTAESILRIANGNREAIKGFFLEDQTWTILRFSYEAGRDPRTAAFSLRSGDGNLLEVLFLRLLACRYLAMERRRLAADKGWERERTGRPRSKATGTGRSFIREKELPLTNQTEDGLKRGEKVLQNEESLGVPEISLVLLPALSRFDHLHSDEAGRFTNMFSLTPVLKDDAIHIPFWLGIAT